MHLNSLYFFILLILLLLATIENVNSYFSKKRNFIFLLLTIVFIAFCGLRPLDFDKDIQMYHSYFDQFCAFSYDEVFFQNPHRVKEKGYIILNKLFCDIGFKGLILFCTILGIGIKALIILRKSNLPFTALFIYVALFLPLREYTQVRDAVASSFLFLAFLLYKDKKYYYSFILFIIAFSFHTMALIYLPVVFLLYILKRDIHYIYLTILGCLLFFLNPTKWLQKIDFLPEQLLKYNNLEGKGSFLILIFTIAVIWFYHYSKQIKKIEFDPENEYYLKLSYIGLFLGMITIDHPVLSRLSNAIIFFTIILLTKILPSWMNVWSRYLLLLFLLTFYYFGIRNFIIINY